VISPCARMNCNARPPLTDWLTALAHDLPLERMALGPLSLDDTVRLAQGWELGRMYLQPPPLLDSGSTAKPVDNPSSLSRQSTCSSIVVGRSKLSRRL